jgi:hypothetical protein
MAWPSVRRPLAGQRALDDRHAALGVGRTHALLRQAPRVGGEQRRRRHRVQPAVVLAAHQVQRAPVQPGDEQRALLDQGAIHVGGRQPRAAGPDGQASAARILRLHRQQASDDRDRVARRRPGEQLRREALGDHTAYP